MKTGALIERLIKSWRSSIIGVGAGAVVLGILSQAGCDMAIVSNPEVWGAVAIPILMGLFRRDESRTKKDAT